MSLLKCVSYYESMGADYPKVKANFDPMNMVGTWQGL